MQECSDLVRGIVSIKHGHVTIHENQLVVALLTVVLSDICDYLVHSFLSIECLFTYLIKIFHVERAI
jgi:hypothetical protein